MDTSDYLEDQAEALAVADLRQRRGRDANKRERGKSARRFAHYQRHTPLASLYHQNRVRALPYHRSKTAPDGIGHNRRKS